MRALFLILFLLSPALSRSGDETVYASAAVASRWLSVPGSARSAALAGAFVARGADPAALEFNPAGLAGMKGWQALATHNAWVGGMSVDRLTGAMNLGCYGTGALSFDSLDLGRAERYTLDASGQPQRQGLVSSNSWAVGAAWAADLGALSLGAALKGLGENVASNSNAGFQGDLGLRYNFDNSLRLGVSAKNLGLDTTNALRPIGLRAGLGRTQLAYGRALALDVAGDWQPYDSEPPLFRAGAEWAAFRSLVFRAGYALGNEREPTGPSFGLGWIRNYLEIDYALSGAGELGWTHLFSLKVLGGGGAL
jgi:hypothetical protein